MTTSEGGISFQAYCTVSTESGTCGGIFDKLGGFSRPSRRRKSKIADAEAAREFQSALDNDPKFALASYSLGRAEMGLRDFAKAIDAYTKCRDLYIARGGERYTDQLSSNRAIDDRILELRTAMNQAGQTGAVKAQSQSQSLYIRELQAQIDRLEQARRRNLGVPIDTSVPYFVPMALGAAYFRSGQFADAERVVQDGDRRQSRLR